ncbi:hypothetical protein [Geodermatophilus sp. DSM 45219]|uniref:VG15 protein n=1 Tax=Geodermatophilus sp. DSM 45219 TaxID=1881103 RepID=UPI00087E7C61|nr:hypothetical protein [Geodermatophilus sp. DSM 45219]SDN79279.1 hypothetical protein SAMN05428965_1648 [Geodermatophilus sp. DSM 45219]
MTTPTSAPEQTIPPAVLAGSVVAGESLQLHRVDLETLLRLALNELGGIWRSLTGRDPNRFRDGLALALPALSEEYGPAAATLGADWYDDMRDLSGVPGTFRAIPAEMPDQGRYDALIGWGTDPLFRGNPEVNEAGEVIRIPKLGDPDFIPDFASAQGRVEGGFQRLVADMDRDSVIGSLKADPQARGWARQTTGESCDFCKMIAGRGAVFSAETATFSSHDRCDCVCVPVLGGDPRPVEKYTPSQRFRSKSQRAANNARIREYLRAP